MAAYLSPSDTRWKTSIAAAVRRKRRASPRGITTSKTKRTNCGASWATPDDRAISAVNPASRRR